MSFRASCGGGGADEAVDASPSSEERMPPRWCGCSTRSRRRSGAGRRRARAARRRPGRGGSRPPPRRLTSRRAQQPLPGRRVPENQYQDRRRRQRQQDHHHPGQQRTSRPTTTSTSAGHPTTPSRPTDSHLATLRHDPPDDLLPGPRRPGRVAGSQVAEFRDDRRGQARPPDGHRPGRARAGIRPAAPAGCRAGGGAGRRRPWFQVRRLRLDGTTSAPPQRPSQARGQGAASGSPPPQPGAVAPAHPFEAPGTTTPWSSCPGPRDDDHELPPDHKRHSARSVRPRPDSPTCSSPTTSRAPWIAVPSKVANPCRGKILTQVSAQVDQQRDRRHRRRPCWPLRVSTSAALMARNLLQFN